MGCRETETYSADRRYGFGSQVALGIAITSSLNGGHAIAKHVVYIVRRLQPLMKHRVWPTGSFLSEAPRHPGKEPIGQALCLDGWIISVVHV